MTPTAKTPRKDLLLEWTEQCFQAAGLEASAKEKRDYAAIAAEAIIDDGLAVFARGSSMPHGSGSNTVAGGNPVPGFVAFLRSAAPSDAVGKLDAFDAIFERFVAETERVEAATGPGGNAAYNRALNAANEILYQFFAERTDDTVRQLHDGFGDASTAPIDLSKVKIGRAGASGGCAIMAVSAGVLFAFAGVAAARFPSDWKRPAAIRR
jgi:hypothetical protein